MTDRTQPKQETRNLRAANMSLERVHNFTHLGTTIDDTSGTTERVKEKIHLENACFYSVTNLLRSRLSTCNTKRGCTRKSYSQYTSIYIENNGIYYH